MEMKTLNLDSVKEIRDLARRKDRDFFNFVDELEMWCIFIFACQSTLFI